MTFKTILMFCESAYNFRVINCKVKNAFLPGGGTAKSEGRGVVGKWLGVFAQFKDLETSKRPPKSIVDVVQFGLAVDFYEGESVIFADKQPHWFIVDI